MKAMILAAGFGTRLFPLTIDRTKPAIPFLNKPLVGYVAEYVSKFGFRDVVVNLHHQPESVRAALGDGTDYGVKIHYTLESPEILGTSGALDNARHLLEDETFLIVNGKIITDIDIQAALDTHRRTGALATMVLKRNEKRERFSVVETDSGMVTGFGGFPEKSGESKEGVSLDARLSSLNSPLMFTGIHILEPRVFEYIPRRVYSDIVPTLYAPAIKNGERIAAHVAEGNWFELSTIPRYLDISLAMLKEGTVCAGNGCRISSSAQVTNSVLWDRVEIGDGAQLNRVILADGVKIEAGDRLENAAVVRAEMLENVEIPEKALKGGRRGENYIVSLTD